MKIPKDMIAGKVHQTNDGAAFVIKYTNYKSVEIEFIKTRHRRQCIAGDLRLGHVKDPFAPKVFGIGYVGVGRHKPTIKRVKTKAYSIWHGMLNRCYNPKVRDKFPSYNDCSVCEEWLNYQNFAEWFYLNYKDGMHLDKDILIDGNKVYSPSACSFVTQAQNTEKAWAKNYKFIDPNGRVVEIYNLSKFCRDNGLNAPHMHQVITGERNHHKGWTRFAGGRDD